MLNSAQEKAIDHVAGYAKSRRGSAINTLEDVLKMSDIDREYFYELMKAWTSKARVALHFHPDRLCQSLKTVADSILESGIYCNQFETNISNGSLTAFSGGARDHWELSLFGGAYHEEKTKHSDRPKYGSLDVIGHSDGPSPRFGSCYFILKPAVTQRCTFTYGDSHLDPRVRGTVDEFDSVVAAIMNDSFLGNIVFGTRLRPVELLCKLSEVLSQTVDQRQISPKGRVLDHYVEAQIHGPVRLAEDVDLLFADSSYKDSPVSLSFQQLSSKFGFPVHWYSGFEMKVSQVPSDLRGPSMPRLAQRVAPCGVLNAQKIGAAASSVVLASETWSEFGTQAHALQELKLLWHVLVSKSENG